MTAYVFVGPTLPRELMPGGGAIVCLPPAAQGDVYRAAQTRPVAIGIIDGYFEGVPSVWHKEILWAMSQGVHVYGSASMGALRAAELHAFGMEGIGRIFEAYRDGSFEDDDDVAVLHGPAEVGYAAVSEPMVNIRFTLERAERDGILGPETRNRLEDSAKRMFYQERRWETLLDVAGQALPEAELAPFRSWLPLGKVDQKQIDALAMLEAMRKRHSAACEPKHTSYTFQWTELWDKAMSLSGAIGSEPAPAGSFILHERLFDELRLDAALFERMHEQALLRLLALRESDRLRLEPPRQKVAAIGKQFRSRRGLFTRLDLDRWLEENDMDQASLAQVLEEEARIESLETMARPALDRHRTTELRLGGDYRRLADRAAGKQAALAGMGLDSAEPGTLGPNPAALLAWYFETRLRRPIPDDVDSAARRMGFPDTREFYRALLREFLYCTHREQVAKADRPEQDG